jgi:acyl carrier protein
MLDEKVARQEDAIRKWLVNYIAPVLEVGSEDFQTSKRCDELGIDSVEGVIMAGMLEEASATQVEPAQWFEHPSVAELSRVLAEALADAQAAPLAEKPCRTAE